ncbi:MAG: helix-turn-helix transcriptional regulator [Clostridia bacterium]|nr:helix-turn-helix transcriptional regulator [Clostridia bacterium]
MAHTPTLVLPVLNIDRIYTAFVQTYDGQFDFPGEYHDMWELGCVLSGKAGITSGTEIYDMSEYDLVIHPRGVFHAAWAKGGERLTILTVSFLGSGVERFVPTGKFIPTEWEVSIIKLLVREISVQSDKNATGRQKRDGGQMLKNLLESLFLSLYRRKGESALPDADRAASRFAEVATYLEKNVDRALTTEAICTECAIGRTVLKELFHAFTGAGVMKYYNCLRIRRATALVAEGLSMAEIAEIMHFSSQSYFSAFFRRETGAPPMRYRSIGK